MPELGPASPFFIVTDVARSLPHYVELLGFECRFHADDTFAIVGRDAAQLMLNAIGPEIPPLPNVQRHEWARWDAFFQVNDPDALATEFTDRGVLYHVPLSDTDDGLRGFEVADPDGYICFFGRPRLARDR